MSTGSLSRRRVIQAAACGMATICLGSSARAEGEQEERAKPAAAHIRIAVVQQETLPGAVERNRNRALAYAKDALRNHADIVLFHEALLTGYVDNVTELAEETDGPTTKAFQELVRGTDSLVLYGLVERDGADCYTAATLVGENGVVANYRKTHLWWKAEGVRHEPTFFGPGNQLVTFDIKGYKCGVMICYDGDFPEMTRAYANRQCVVLFWLNNRGSRGHKEVAPLARANSMIMAASCCCGENDTDRVYRGGSNITGVNGSLLEEIWDDEGIIYADVDPRPVLRLRDQNPWFRGQRPDLYR